MPRSVTASHLLRTVLPKYVLLKDFRTTISDIGKVNWCLPPLECWKLTHYELVSKIRPCVRVQPFWEFLQMQLLPIRNFFQPRPKESHLPFQDTWNLHQTKCCLSRAILFSHLLSLKTTSLHFKAFKFSPKWVGGALLLHSTAGFIHLASLATGHGLGGSGWRI